ncbi:hypothetical protein LCGC14_1250730 [marine sediment metagenome]|uniref:Uncharacterized protein n=1 Tax=marine sediment metagenome TaxID=412755 RepID=A0A0F9L6V5_9ZZZZ
MGTVTKEELLKEFVIELLLMLAHLSMMSDLEFKED